DEMYTVYKVRVLKDHLRNLSIFSDLTDEQFVQIRDTVELIRCKDGDLIYDEQDRSDGMYIIRNGLVKVMKNVSSLLGPDDVLNWSKLLAFVRGDPSQLAAVAEHLCPSLSEVVRTAANEAGGSTGAGKKKLIEE